MAKNKKRRFLGFFKDIKGELKKVTWPSFKQVRNNTLIVIICVLIIGAFIWLLDALFGFSFGKVVEKANEPAAPATEATAPATGTTDANIAPELNIPTDVQTEAGSADTGATGTSETPQQ
ncbi:MAG: preprotein translocase subunit SecE [Clostridia bacterium]|nr:preprotein translocase subunit SecE [Clostridia bacterium]